MSVRPHPPSGLTFPRACFLEEMQYFLHFLGWPPNS